MNAPTPFQLLARITKIDEEKREVTGIITSEAIDKANERLDYEKSKPAFESWMKQFSDATKGASKGNLREMHGKVAAGKFVDIQFDDANKQIIGTAKVVDDAAWQKTRLGVYTGFSIGGNYGETWADPENPKVLCFAPSEIVETSLVDNPCNPDATFIAIKANGEQEMRKFVSVGNFADDEVDSVEQGWKAADGSFHATKAKAVRHNIQLKAMKKAAEITAPAEAALKKLADDTAADIAKSEGDGEGEPAAADPIVTAEAQPDGTVEGAADTTPAEPAAEPAPTPEAGAPVAEATPAAEPAPAATEADTAAEGEAVKATPTAILKKAAPAEGEAVRKGMWSIAQLADTIDCLCWLQDSLDWEAMYEKDGSTLPDELKGHIAALCEFLRRLVEEETREITEGDEDVMELAAMPMKTLTAILKNARAASAVGAVVKAIGKAAIAQREAADPTAFSKVAAERDAVTDTLKDLTARTTEAITKLQTEVADLKRQPQAPKGFVRAVAVGKGQDEGAAASGTGGKATVETVQAQMEKLSPEERAKLAMVLAMRHPTPASATK